MVSQPHLYPFPAYFAPMFPIFPNFPPFTPIFPHFSLGAFTSPPPPPEPYCQPQSCFWDISGQNLPISPLRIKKFPNLTPFPPIVSGLTFQR